MRVIAGSLGGRQFKSPHGHRTHPMSDKARGGLFNALGKLDGLTVLDAFAGSGALAFEAVSRGAKSAICLDRDRNAQLAIADNIRSLDLAGKVRLIRASANSWLSTSDQRFDLVLLDPPFDDLQPVLLADLAGLTCPGGLTVVSLPAGQQIVMTDGFEHLKTRSYGDNQLVFYRKVS